MTGNAVAIVRGAGEAATAILDGALAQIDFRKRVRAMMAARTDVGVVIAPALDAFVAGSPAATDPRLVEHLIDLLFDLGAARVDVVGTRDSSALWLENRDPFMVADLLGYRYETPQGRAYDVIDLADDQIESALPDVGPLSGAALSRVWADADIRIVFAANRTDEDDGYSLCLSTLLGVLPLTDKDYHYRHRRDPGAVVGALLASSPVAFALIDAVVSAHGNGGSRDPYAIATDTIVAATDPALADHHGALLMGLDPFISRLAAPCLRRPGLLADVRTTGTLTPHPGWINVDPLLIEATALRRRSVAIDRSVRPLLQHVDRDLFPFSNPLNDRANAAIATLFAGANDARLLAPLNFWLARAGDAQRAWATQFAKDSLRRIDAPVDVDPATFKNADFDAIAGELLPLVDLLSGVAADRTGLRWRSHDGAILFDGVRLYPIPFDDFTAAVEVHRAITYMNDYIGGSAIVVARDARGRVTRQIERNLYLPQPNYTILFGGDVIDVTKIEAVSYSPRRHRMAWKTIGSANDSAIADDGTVTFESLGDDTLVTVRGRQHFRLPPLLAALDLDLLPALKHLVVTDAYRQFFRRTFANLEAVAEGRDVCIGRAWDDEEEPLPVERLTEFVTALGDPGDFDLGGWIRSLGTTSDDARAPIRIDDDGFRHFDAAPGPTDRRGWRLLDDVRADLQRAARFDAGLIR